MSKLDLAKVLIENEWYGKTLDFLAKAYKIDEDTFQRFIDGTRPNISQKDIDNYLKKVEELLEKEEPKINEQL